MTQEATGRKPAPEIKGEEDERLTNGSNLATPTSPTASEPKNFKDGLTLARLKFGQNLVGWCVFLIVVLSVVGYFFPGAKERPLDSQLLEGTIDILKLIATTALGFVLARELDESSARKSLDAGR